ncbi:MAG: DUF4249 domain-containing protein [Niabella sp.]|nr:DUF4249 domain-containing protein [Niabella sp.]
MRLRYCCYCLLFFFSALSCKDRYVPDIQSTGTGYLVVEGVLNAGNAPTTLTVSRTKKVASGNQPAYESNASITVEGTDNSAKQLTMTSAGIYQNNNLNLSASNKYRVRIKTGDGKEYLSDFVAVKITPPIDSIGWKSNSDGVQLYVNTHDPANNTIYYRWDWDETWEIHSYYQSSLIYDPKSPLADAAGVRYRVFPQEDVNTCWRYGKSTSLLFASSAKLTADVIHEFPINEIPSGDDRLSVKYSILLRQYAMDKAAYEFYDLMKKNTESIGSIFDPMPSELRGNIHCVTNPSETVIGYIAAATVTQKRVFIASPPGWNLQQGCSLQFVIKNSDSTKAYFGAGAIVPINQNKRTDPPPPADGYDASTAICVDCTARGGSTQKPTYWP